MEIVTRTTRLTALGAAVASAALAAAMTTAPTAQAAPEGPDGSVAVAWAPADTAAITPGVQTNTAGSGQCTANFVFTDAAGSVYVGQAAHCASTGEATDTDGCLAQSLPLGTRVTFNRGGSLVGAGEQVGAGTLVYSSWLTMQARRESDPDTCAYNDFALVKVDAEDVAKVNPSIPFWGGPNGVNTAGTATGDHVYSFGNSGIRAGIEQLGPKAGVSLGADGGGWTHAVYTLTPGVPGDSGSAFLDAEGKALGTLSTLALAPLPASNGVGDLGRELAYAQQHGSLSGLALAHGTEPFSPIL
ncbi:hypothetical protein LRP67_08900 [Nocardioides sp. cx-169]|uniref:hypothetical protein n=1 Tax=Nocardioides sp. cx-169 TaxID=2899080 RepID=UPI001E4076AE|nr:hypothetical protein [Nocardioides sp. cx-169]MCD4534196.1 hypothetical protein [Nocardioides sp. cx-169]